MPDDQRGKSTPRAKEELSGKAGVRSRPAGVLLLRGHAGPGEGIGLRNPSPCCQQGGFHLRKVLASRQAPKGAEQPVSTAHNILKAQTWTQAGGAAFVQMEDGFRSKKRRQEQ